jgi:hypothetical protein
MHMSARVHLILDPGEHAAFRARAADEGKTLSEWLREAARERLQRTRPAHIDSVDDLDRFFAERDAAESGEEPDWDQHVEVMHRSRSHGLEAG